MSIFSHMKNFNLEIHDSQVEWHLQREGLHMFCLLPPPQVKKLIGHEVKGVHGEHRMITIMRELYLQGKINKEWISFIKWYIGLDTFNGKYIFRGEKAEFYKYVLKYGNGGYKLKHVYDSDKFRKANLSKADIVWGSRHLSKAWEYVGKLKHSLLVVYKSKHLIDCIDLVGMSGHYAYRLKNKDLDWKDQIEAIIKIRYRISHKRH